MSVKVHEIVTQRILEELEKGVIPWRKTWQGSQPINYITRKQYRGINLLLLPHGGEYLSYKQAKDLGGNVKKGEKAHMIVFYKMLQNVDEESGKISNFPYLRYSNVFHISQCEGIESKLEPIEIDSSIEPIQAAQDIINDYVKRSKVTINHVEGSHRAYYSPTIDTVTLPVIGQFTSNNEYYSTNFHELAHSTGHKSRLKRITDVAAFGSETYSREELTAEITSAILMSISGIEQPETFTNSVAYIHGWSRKLKEDNKAIITASSQAQKAADLILGESEN